MEVKFVEVDGNKFIDDGTGSPKLDDIGNPVPYVEPTVPYERFKEVNDKLKNLTGEIETLKGQKKEGTLTEAQQKELEAKTYLKNLLKETLSEEEKVKAEKDKQEQTQFEQSVNDLLDLNKDVKRDEFLTFLEKHGDDYTNIGAAMRSYKSLTTAEKEAVEKVKKEFARKPGMPANEGGGGGGAAVDTDKGKSLWQIADEALKGHK